MLFGLVAHLIQEKRALIKADLLCLLAFSIGATVLFLAPGNFVRANNAIYAAFYNLSVPERINRNIPALIRIVFAKQNYPIFIIFLVTNFLYLMPFVVKEQRMRTPSIVLAAAQAMFLLPLLTFFTASLVHGSLPLMNHTMVWLTQELFRSLFLVASDPRDEHSGLSALFSTTLASHPGIYLVVCCRSLRFFFTF